MLKYAGVAAAFCFPRYDLHSTQCYSPSVVPEIGGLSPGSVGPLS